MKIQVMTRAEKTERKEMAARERHRRLENWHFFLAIWPRRVVSGTFSVNECRWTEGPWEHIVWLETIARRGHWDGHKWKWDFGPITNVLKQS